MVNGIQAQPNGDNSKVKIKVRVNIHGVFVVSTAYTVETVVEEASEVSEPMETDNAAEGTEQAPADSANADKAADEQPTEDKPAEDEQKPAEVSILISFMSRFML